MHDIRDYIYLHVHKGALRLSYTLSASYYRILVNCVPHFDQFRREVQWHIPHERQKEMSAKSVVVSQTTADVRLSCALHVYCLHVVTSCYTSCTRSPLE